VGSKRRSKEPAGVLLFRLGILVPVVGGLAFAVYRNPHSFFRPALIFWVFVLAVIELFPVPARGGLQLSLGFPLRLALAILYPPAVAAGVSFVGTLDPRELTGNRPVLLALADRSQIALSVFVGSEVFHSMATIYPPASPTYVLLASILLATIADYAVNVGIVGLYMRVLTRSSFREVLSGMTMGSLREFVLSYLGLSLIGAVIARLYLSAQLWAVVAFLLPLLFARQMFFRTMALEKATDELKDRERLLRELSNRMAEERADERMQIAGYLHDELAQLLFRLSLQLGSARKRLASKQLGDLAKNLDDLNETKQKATEMVRALIRDLHRSPVGRAGLADAVRSFAADAGRDFPVRISVELASVHLPPAIQLLLYQIAREATLNALKHADAKLVSITLRDGPEGVELRVHDDGAAFDPGTKPAEGHFGLPMMRERARLAGGALSIESAAGRGTTITATVPRMWTEEEMRQEDSGSAREAARTVPPAAEPAAASNGRPGKQRVAKPKPSRRTTPAGTAAKARPVPAQRPR